MKNPTLSRMTLILAVAVVGMILVAATVGTSAGGRLGPAASPTGGRPSDQLDATSNDSSLAPDPTLTAGASGADSGEHLASTPSATPSSALASSTTALAPAKAPPTARPTAKPTARPTPTPPPAWVTVVDDTFGSGRVPSHWSTYDAPYGSGAQNCAAPSHVTVSGGVLHLRLSYESAGAGSADCGPGWYSGGISLSGHSSVDQRVTVRFRVVRDGVASHFIIPMRWPDDDGGWPAVGEEDYCETSDIGECSTYLHYGPDNQQIERRFAVDMSHWHTIRTERRGNRVRIYLDDMTHPVWTYVGSSDTLPATLKHVVLQQECGSSCPDGTSGSEDIQIDRITVANPG
jgi:hypothetical protein